MQFENILTCIGAATLSVSPFLVYWFITAKSRALHKTTTPSHPCETFHQELVLISRQGGIAVDFAGNKSLTTLVLRACLRCGQHVVFALPGDWSLEELSKKRSDIDELNRMVRG